MAARETIASHPQCEPCANQFGGELLLLRILFHPIKFIFTAMFHTHSRWINQSRYMMQFGPLPFLFVWHLHIGFDFLFICRGDGCFSLLFMCPFFVHFTLCVYRRFSLWFDFASHRITFIFHLLPLSNIYKGTSIAG